MISNQRYNTSQFVHILILSEISTDQDDSKYSHFQSNIRRAKNITKIIFLFIDRNFSLFFLIFGRNQNKKKKNPITISDTSSLFCSGIATQRKYIIEFKSKILIKNKCFFQKRDLQNTIEKAHTTINHTKNITIL